MTTITEKDLLDEFLFGRTKLANNLSYEKFKKLFPKGTNEDTLKEIYNHLRNLDSKTKRSLKKSLDGTFTNSKILEVTHFSIGHQEHDTVGKINNNLSSLSNILDSELEVLLEKYNNELDELKLEIQGFDDLTFVSEQAEYSTSIRELVELVNILNNEPKGKLSCI